MKDRLNSRPACLAPVAITAVSTLSMLCFRTPFFRSGRNDLPLDGIQKLGTATQKTRVRKRATIKTVRDPVKAIKVQLPHKRCNVTLPEKVGSDICHEEFGIVNLERSSIRSERDNVRVSMPFHVGQEVVQLDGERYLLAPAAVPTDGCWC
jgi:hypothetical protein